MRVIYTCKCGKALDIDADSLALAELAVREFGWLAEFGVVPRCKECINDESGRIREESDQQAPR